IVDDRIFQIIPTIAGKYYQLSFWVNNHISGQDRLGVFWEGNPIVWQNPCSQPLDQWSLVTRFLHATTSGSQLLFGLTDSPGVIYIDDVAMDLVACPGDVTGNGTVNIDDLLTVINHWGGCPGSGSCAAAVDLNGV